MSESPDRRARTSWILLLGTLLGASAGTWAIWGSRERYPPLLFVLLMGAMVLVFRQAYLMYREIEHERSSEPESDGAGEQ